MIVHSLVCSFAFPPFRSPFPFSMRNARRRVGFQCVLMLVQLKLHYAPWIWYIHWWNPPFLIPSFEHVINRRMSFIPHWLRALAALPKLEQLTKLIPPASHPSVCLRWNEKERTIRLMESRGADKKWPMMEHRRDDIERKGCKKARRAWRWVGKRTRTVFISFGLAFENNICVVHFALVRCRTDFHNRSRKWAAERAMRALSESDVVDWLSCNAEYVWIRCLWAMCDTRIRSEWKGEKHEHRIAFRPNLLLSTRSIDKCVQIKNIYCELHRKNIPAVQMQQLSSWWFVICIWFVIDFQA